MDTCGPSRPTSLIYGEWAAVTSGEVRCLAPSRKSVREDGACGKLVLRLGKAFKGHVRLIPKKAPISKHGVAAVCISCGAEHEIVEAKREEKVA